MSDSTDLAALEREYRTLRQRLYLPDSLLLPDAPMAARQLDLARIRPLLASTHPWDAEDAFAEPDRLMRDVFRATREGNRIRLAAECDLLGRVARAETELLHRSPFDLLELVLPVVWQGRTVHLVRSGKFREKAWSGADLDDLAFATGVPRAKVADAAAAVPVLHGAALEAWAAQHRRYRDLLAASLAACGAAGSASAASEDEENLQALGALAEGMAHHVSNQLAVVLGYTSMVLDKAPLAPEHAEALRTVAEATQRARRFTEEVLSLSQTAHAEQTGCSVHDRIGRILQLLESRTPGRVRVELALAAAHDTVRAESLLLQQMLLNLLSNAYDAAATSGGVLRVTTRNLPSKGGAGELVQIEVAEGDGKPVADRQLARLAGQLARMEGSVEQGGAGSRTMVTLPVAVPGAAAPEKKVRRRLAPSCLWVADDDAVVRAMCRRVLEAEGHSVEELESGEALRKALHTAEARPDLILYDFMMPDADGSEMAVWLREQGHRTPLILISGFTADHPAVRQTLKLRKTFLLQKPFTFRDLADLVTIAMGETLVGG